MLHKNVMRCQITIYSRLPSTKNWVHILDFMSVETLLKLVDLKYPFVGESFELKIWHTCYQHKYDFMKNFMGKKKFSILGRVAKLATVKFSTCW